MGATGEHPRKPLHILIVEDVDSMRELLAQLLEGVPDLRVSGTVRNGVEARLEVTRRRPGLVLLDEILPGESSGDLLQDLEKQGIPVLLLTSLLEPIHPVPSGVLGRLVKPGWKTIEKDRARFVSGIRRMLRLAD